MCSAQCRTTTTPNTISIALWYLVLSRPPAPSKCLSPVPAGDVAVITTPYGRRFPLILPDPAQTSERCGTGWYGRANIDRKSCSIFAPPSTRRTSPDAIASSTVIEEAIASGLVRRVDGGAKMLHDFLSMFALPYQPVPQRSLV